MLSSRLIHILQVPASSLGLESNYSDWCSRFSSIPPWNVAMVPQTGRDHLIL